MTYEHKIGWCPFCNQGWAEIVKDKRDNEIIVVCNECFSVWKSPEDFRKNIPLKGYQHDNSFKITSATIEEIENRNWMAYVLK